MALGAETARTDLALVAFAPGRDLPGMASVRIDDFAAARDMTSMLLDQRHRRIGFITAPRSLGVFESRRGGYLAALHARGMEIDHDLILEGQMDFRSGFAAAAEMLNLANPPTAIFASNDDMAAGALVAARSLGIDVPNALSVAGFDDTPLATKLWPPLTTVRFPVIEMAELAIEMLVEAARSHVPPPPVTRYLSYSIVERASTGTEPKASPPAS
jgi:LacI family transcriptional regulator